MLFVFAALLIVNLISFFIMGIDKRRAIRNKWRVPERILFLYAAIGGAWGAYIGMHIFHHKTRKPLFRYGMPALCAFDTVIFALIFLRSAHWL